MVREGEFDRTAAGAPLFSRLEVLGNKLATGEKLTDQQRAEFDDIITTFHRVGQGNAIKSLSSFNNVINTYGYGRERVMPSWAGGQTESTPVEASAKAAPGIPKAGAVIKGYEFLGGDPKEKKNWKKKD